MSDPAAQNGSVEPPLVTTTKEPPKETKIVSTYVYMNFHLNYYIKLPMIIHEKKKLKI